MAHLWFNGKKIYIRVSIRRLLLRKKGDKEGTLACSLNIRKEESDGIRENSRYTAKMERLNRNKR